MFFAMFYGDLAEKEDVVELPDCASEGLLELLRYLYCDEVELTGSNVMQVLYLAKKYMVPSLALKCSKFLESNLTPASVFSVLPSAMKHEDKSLVKKCWQIIDKQGVEAVKSESFKWIDKALLSLVLERSTLHCSEVELFKAVMSWASTECSRRGLRDSGAEKRNVLGKELLHLCRYPLMTQVEFVDTVLPTDVLDKNEIVQMFTYFGKGSTESFTRVPRGERQILRFERFKSANANSSSQWRYISGNVDSLTFSVDQLILIHGVKLFGCKDSTYKTDISFYKKQSLLFKKNGSYISVLGEAGYYGYEVMFDQPIQLSAGQEYTITAFIQGSTSWYGEGGTSSKTCKGVKFFFTEKTSSNGTSAGAGQFPEIIFTKA